MGSTGWDEAWFRVRVFVLVLAFGCAGVEVGPASVTTAGSEEACRSITGLVGLLVPGRVILLGEQHGTVESPAFLLDLACHAARSGLALTVGLELSSAGQERVDRYLDSAGGEVDRAALVAGDSWKRDYQDGRNSRSMAELIDGLRVLRQEGHTVKAVLFDADHGHGRDAGMAEKLSVSARQNPDGLVLVLTGNLHSRVVSGGRSDPMGYLLSLSVGSDRVVSLDVAHLGGSAWLCFGKMPGTALQNYVIHGSSLAA